MNGYTTSEESEAAYLVDQHSCLEGEESCRDRDRDHIVTQYNSNKTAKVGDKVKCPCCLNTFKKKSYQHAFCRNKGRNNCKDYFWNTTDDQRLERAKIFNR